eukprot:gene20965-21715_t
MTTPLSHIRNFSIVAHIDHGKSTLADRLIQQTGTMADRDMVEQEQIEEVIGIDASNAVLISAKTGLGIPDVLEAIVTRLPPPKGDISKPLKAMLVDSWYDTYLGVVVLVRVVDGILKEGMRIRMMGTGAAYDIEKVGVFTPKLINVGSLGPGEMGAITGSIKEVADTRVGDTITDDRKPTDAMLPGFKPAQPVVFCGLFPVDAAEFDDLRAAMGKLRLNDASFSYEMESSIALTDGTDIELHNPADMPDVMKIASINEPWIRATIL